MTIGERCSELVLRSSLPSFLQVGLGLARGAGAEDRACLYGREGAEGCSPVDEVRLKTDLAALRKGDQVVICRQGMNDKVSDAFDR